MSWTAVELRDEELDREQFDQMKTGFPPQESISNWWWLLPPVAYYRNRKRNDAYRKAIMAALPSTAREQFVGFMNKANGWFFVAGGAFLIALKETWELIELFDLPIVVYWIAVVLLAIAAVSNTVVRMSRADSILHADDPDFQAKRKAERTSEMERRRSQQGMPARPQRTKKPPPAAGA